MAGLLDLLMGSNAAATTPPPQANPAGFGYDPNGYLTHNPPGAPPQPGALVQQTAQQSPAMPLAQAAVNPQTDPSQAPVTVTGAAPDQWQPKKASVLGQIADYFLGTHFGKNTHRENLEGAYQDALTDPQGTYQRLDKFDPDAAASFYQHYVDNTRAQGGQDRMNAVYQDAHDGRTMAILQNMAMNADPKDPANLKAHRDQMQSYATAKGLPPELMQTIPGEGASADDWQTFANGGIPAAKQMSNTTQVENHVMQNNRGVARNEETARFHSAEIGLGGGRLGVSQTNAATGKQNADAHTEAVNKEPTRSGTAFFDTHMGRAERSKDGMTLMVTPNDPRLDQSKMVKGKDGKAYIRYDNFGTPDKPSWRLHTP